MLRNNKGFGSLTLYGALGVAAVIAAMGIALYIQSLHIKALDADNKRLAAAVDDLKNANDGLAVTLEKERKACEGTTARCKKMLDECINSTSKPCTVVDIKGCPDIKTTNDPKQDLELGKLQGIWGSQP